MTAVQTADPVEAARLEWRTAFDRVNAHRATCDDYVVNNPCAGCALLLRREHVAHNRYEVAIKMGGR